MPKLIIDTDPGIDDAMAIHLAFAHPDIEVVGLTTVFGNVHVDKATRNALALVEMAHADCPVSEGASRPLIQPLNPPSYFVHGDEGLGDLPAPTPSAMADPRPADAFIVDTVNAAPGEIVLCPVGPLTNIARALRRDPSIARKVAGVVIMGGAVEEHGNVTEWAEANIWNDPHAADEVFAADWPITLVGLDVTEDVRCGPDDFAELARASPGIGGFLNEIVQFYFGFHRGKEIMDGCFLHDPTAVLACVDTSPFTITEIPLETVVSGDRIGQTRPAPESGRRPVRVCMDVDAPAVRQEFLHHLARADACRDARSH